MEKSLLLSAFAMIATTVCAQPFAESIPFSARQLGTKLVPFTQSTVQKAVKVATKDKPNYYMRPDGALYWTSDKKGTMYGSVYMYVQGGTDLAFNKVQAEAGQTYWHLNVYDWYGECTSYDVTGKTSDSYYTDDKGDFHLNMKFDGGNSLPTLTWATDSFTIGEENPYWAPNTDENPDAFMKYYSQVFAGINIINSRVMPLSFTDDHVSEVYFGGMDNHYTYGSGEYTESESKKYTATGVYQYFEKPMAPLYVEDIFMPVVSKGYYPIAKGKQLKMQIHDVLEVNGQRIPGENILYELTATEPDVVDMGSLEYDELTSYNAFTLVFKKNNAEGKAEPFVINQPFYVVVYGLDEEGIDCGFEVSLLPKYYKDADGAVGIWKDAANQPDYFSLYEQKAALKVSFTGKFDYCNPVYYGPDENYGIVKVSNDGNTASTIVENSDVYPGIMMKLNGDWTDEDGNANYTITGAADWVKSIEADETTYKDYEVTLLTVKCDALPEGVSGRSCTLTVHGTGVESTYPIEILQGDAVPTAVNGVKVNTSASNNATYNVAGQRVAEGTKGLVIRDGKKYMNK